MTMTRVFYTPPQLQKLSGIKMDNLLEFIRTGELKAYNTALDPNGKRPRWRIWKSDWEAFLESRANAPAPPPMPKRKRRRRKAGSATTEWF
jgi:hypothetical protein